MNWSFLSNPQFWTACIALISLALTLQPKLRELIEKPKIRIKVPELFQFWHVLGNPNLGIYLEIRNVGARKVDIAGIDLWIVPPDSRRSALNLPVQTYYSRQQIIAGQSLEFPISSVSLKSGEQWFEYIHCYEWWSAAEEVEVNEIISKFRRDIAKKLVTLPPGSRPEVDEALVAQANRFAKQKSEQFRVDIGNYQLLIAVVADLNQVLCFRGYDFTLFPSNIQDLQASVEDYKYGSGVSHGQYVEINPYLTVRLRQVPEQQALQAYKRLRSDYKL